MSEDIEKKQRLSEADIERKADYLIDRGYTEISREDLIKKIKETPPTHNGNHGDLDKAL